MLINSKHLRMSVPAIIGVSVFMQTFYIEKSPGKHLKSVENVSMLPSSAYRVGIQDGCWFTGAKVTHNDGGLKRERLWERWQPSPWEAGRWVVSCLPWGRRAGWCEPQRSSSLQRALAWWLCWCVGQPELWIPWPIKTERRIMCGPCVRERDLKSPGYKWWLQR